MSSSAKNKAEEKREDGFSWFPILPLSLRNDELYFL
jgi:hypothetical protein